MSCGYSGSEGSVLEIRFIGRSPHPSPFPWEGKEEMHDWWVMKTKKLSFISILVGNESTTSTKVISGTVYRIIGCLARGGIFMIGQAQPHSWYIVTWRERRCNWLSPTEKRRPAELQSCHEAIRRFMCTDVCGLNSIPWTGVVKWMRTELARGCEMIGQWEACDEISASRSPTRKQIDWRLWRPFSI